ncbi:calcium-binding protein [Falsirhodobacter halotolerans]|uniref:calcium-binding protein n=1 Tax=Falsirhodobacter halotolerans TaxID=1146892 RepID=UPI001FD20578|nr:calcium-binding protein [Falsirhodobacter halotolerans]MCJ8141246.1 calcium-binding protein [Falsirhodobacter halotolerans]
MASTSHLNIINLQVMAEDQIAIDQANGTYAENQASNSKYYLWQSDFQTIPVAMTGNPELYAARLRDALPEVTTLRMPFNTHSFNADGTLHPQYERFLEAAVKEGFTLIMVQMNGEAQELTASGPDAVGQMRDALTGEVYTSMETAWTQMLDWMDGHPAVQDAVYGYEIVNEPAAYNTATQLSSNRPQALNEFVALYAEHMVQLGQMIEERAGDAKIMVGGWNYSAQFQQLADISMGSGSALDYIREGLGDSLVWSAHLYPGWLGTGGMSDPDDVRARLDEIYGPILADEMILTETNAQGNQAYNLISDRPEVQGFTGAYDWFADHGVAISWFTGSQYGESNLSRMDPDGTLRFVQQGSYAAAMDAFSLGGEDAAHAGAENVDVQLIRGFLRNQTNDPDYNPGNPFDIAQYLGVAFGHGGNDTLTGSDQANNFLYGGTGNDSVMGSRYDDFLYGQDGNDTVHGGAGGHDHLFGGRGDDSIFGGAGISQMYGGAGGDTFVAHPHGRTILVDFAPSEGDALIVNQRNFGPDAFRANAQAFDFDGTGPLDLRVTLPGGGEIVIIGMGERIDEVVGALLPAEGNVEPVDPISSDQLLQGRQGPDTLEGGDGNDTIYGDPENSFGDDSITGGAGNDLIYGVGGNDWIHSGVGTDTVYGGNGNDTIYGGLHNDVLYGDGGNDEIYGENGNDSIYGGAGNDLLNGGGGSDVMEGGDGSDMMLGEGGNDLMYGGNGNDTMYGGNHNDTLYGEGSNDLMYGDRGNDVLYGGLGQDTLYGGADDDQLYGEDSSDLLYGEAGNDTLNGGGGTDTLHGGDGNDVLDGGLANDRLYGEAGNDILLGGGGNDWISGGSGQDVATGGSGSDTFVFDFGDDQLTVTDFSLRENDILHINAQLVGGDMTLAALQDRMTVNGLGTTITFDNGDLLFLQNFQGTLTENHVDYF